MDNQEIDILYEDNHIIVVNKKVSDLTQKDQTGDISLIEKIKNYLKIKYNKQGDVFLGLVHRLDRPVSGAVIYAKTSKALSRLNLMLKNKEITKKYWAIVKEPPTENEKLLTHYMVKNIEKNKSYAYNKPGKNTKMAQLQYQLLAESDRYYLLEINLITGRHHQIRSQLSQIGCHIKGDLKYGYPRPNPDKGICLHARYLGFIHPVMKEKVDIIAPVPDDGLWKVFEKIVSEKK